MKMGLTRAKIAKMMSCFVLVRDDACCGAPCARDLSSWRDRFRVGLLFSEIESRSRGALSHCAYSARDQDVSNTLEGVSNVRGRRHATRNQPNPTHRACDCHTVGKGGTRKQPNHGPAYPPLVKEGVKDMARSCKSPDQAGPSGGESGTSLSGKLNDKPEKSSLYASIQAIVYKVAPKSYREEQHGRPQPPHTKRTKTRRPVYERAETNLKRERERLIALITKTSDQRLKKLFPAVQAVLTKKRAANAVLHAKSSSRIRSKRLSVDRGETRSSNGKLMLPALPANLRWPRKRFSTEYHKHGVTIVQFLEQEWTSLIKAGFGQLRWLRLVDPSAARAVDTYERIDPRTKQRRMLPEHLRFLRERQVTDEKLARGLDEIKKDPRLLETIAGRIRRGIQVHL
jgi:hypothetical protein